MEIKNCAAIVTGGASGMGFATAKMLSQQGAKVAIFDLNKPAAEKAAIETGGLAVLCDISKTESVANALAIAEKHQGPARICINCAGVIYGRRMINKQGAMPLDAFRKVIEINLVGTFNVMMLAAQAMLPLVTTNESGERGVIINTASIAAFEGQIGQTAYSASKGGIVGLTLPAARELAQFGIRVLTIAPGLVDTPMFAKISSEARIALEESIPFPKRLAKSEEYAKLARHIIDNTMLNGTVIRLDGAMRLP